jgi:nucleoside-diphosphate-sugar epimerase
VALDQTSIRLILAAIDNTRKPLLYTSGLGVVGDTGHRTVDEETAFTPPPHMVWRRQLERQVLASAHGVVVRPPLVYGRGGGHVLETMIRTAWERGRAVYPDPGTNAWPNVHVDDLGHAYALALERSPTGAVLHPIGGTSTAKAMTEAVAALIGRPDAAIALPLDQAHLELPIADWMTVSQRVDSRRTRSLLGWHPEGPSITDDITTGSYHRLIEA